MVFFSLDISCGTLTTILVNSCIFFVKMSLSSLCWYCPGRLMGICQECVLRFHLENHIVFVWDSSEISSILVHARILAWYLEKWIRYSCHSPYFNVFKYPCFFHAFIIGFVFNVYVCPLVYLLFYLCPFPLMSAGVMPISCLISEFSSVHPFSIIHVVTSWINWFTFFWNWIFLQWWLLLVMIWIVLCSKLTNV